MTGGACLALAGMVIDVIVFTDEEKFFNMLDNALYLFKDLIDFYSVLPEAPTSVPLSEV